MAVEPCAERRLRAPADPHVAYWVGSEDAPIALARLARCGRYACRCGEGGEDRADLDALAERTEGWVLRDD